MRNRLIAGLSAAVVVIEAAQASGSLITARWAVDLGKLVCALPGRVDHPMARGCHRLLREGALLVEDPDEVLAELGLFRAGALAADPRDAGAQSAGEPDSGVLELLRGETCTAEELAQRTGRELSSVLVELVELELAGRARRLPGGLYARLDPR